jgi:ribosome-binding protein aMBF1 (putative translation factor)
MITTTCFPVLLARARPERKVSGDGAQRPIWRVYGYSIPPQPDLGLTRGPHASRRSVSAHRDHLKAHVTDSPWTDVRQTSIMPSMAAHIDVLTRFGRRVRALRTARGQSQETFADACGLDRTYLSGIERGRRNVGLKNIEVIAQALGITLSELFEGV